VPIFELAILRHYRRPNELNRAGSMPGFLRAAQGHRVAGWYPTSVEQFFRHGVALLYPNTDRRLGAAGRPSATDFLTLLFFALDVDLPTQQLGRQPHILPFLPMASEGESSTITSMCSSASMTTIRLTLAGSAHGCKHPDRRIFSVDLLPRNSRMMDCTRMPFMPTQAPTLSTSRSRLCTAILVRSPASRAQP
jgi:hypothetical protein